MQTKLVQLQNLIYGVVTDVIPPAEIEQTIIQIWSWAQEIFTEAEIAHIKQLATQDLDIKTLNLAKRELLELDVALIHKVNEQTSTASIQAVVARYEQALKIKAQENKALEIKLPTIHEQVQKAIATTAQLVQNTSPEIAQTLGNIAPTIQTQLSEPATMVTAIATLTHPLLPTPFAKPIKALLPAAQDLHITITAQLPDSTPPEIVDEVLIAKLIQVKLPNLDSKIEAFIHKPVDTQPVMQTVKKFDLHPTSIAQHLTAKFIQAKVPQQTAEEVATHLTNFAPAIQLTLGYAKKPDQPQIATSLNKVAIPASAHTKLYARQILLVLGQVNWVEIYRQQYGPAETYQYQPQLQNGKDPYMSFLVNQVKSLGQDAVTTAALDAVVAGPVGAWVVSGIEFGTLEGVGAYAAGGTAAALTGPVGWIVGGLTAIGVYITTKLPIVKDIINKIWDGVKWTFKFIKDDILAPLGTGGLIALGSLGGFVIAGPAGAVTGAVTTTVISIVGGANPLGFVQNMSTALVELAVVEIATPVIVIMLSVPIVVALLLFIINSSAYVVPPAGITTGFPSGLGGKYPSCWPTTGIINQLACYDYPSNSPPFSHCSYPFKPTTNAIDITAPAGTPIFATHDGLATPRSGTITGYGNFVRIVADDRSFSTYYAHLLRFTFHDDREVKAGDIIGFVDQTGFSSGDHLHYGFDSDIPIKRILPPETIYKKDAATIGCQAKDVGGSGTLVQ